MSLTFITGGARSGKSRFAEELTRKKEGQTTYIATAIPFDQQMKDRIKKHQLQRPSEWKTIETYKNFKNLNKNLDFINSKNILFDCLTLMLNNQMLDYDYNWDEIEVEKVNNLEKQIFKDVKDLVNLLKMKDSIIVSNEIGMGIVPISYFTNYYRDILGRFNQYIASQADNVYFTVSGIPLKIK